MTAQQTFNRFLFAIAASQEKAITTDCERADAVMQFRDAMGRLRSINSAMAAQLLPPSTSNPEGK